MSKLSNKKIISLISIALLIIIGVAASMISYSIATKGNGDKAAGDIEENAISENGVTNLGATSSTNISNIDLIIEKANATPAETFNIVEIIPNGFTDDGLKNYVQNPTAGFAKYVFDENRSSATQTMPADKLTYNKIVISAGTLLTDTYGSGTVQSVLDSADLIYLNSPGYDAFAGTNNMSEDIYNYLHYYALGKNKPLVLDYVVKSQTVTADKTYKSFMTSVKRNYVSYRTYPWGNNVTAANFFKGVGSYYLPYYVDNTTGKKSGKVLVLTGSDTPESDSIYTKLNGYKDTMKTVAYYGDDAYKPDDITFDFINVTKVGQSGYTYDEAGLIAAVNNTDYDFIVVEQNTKNQVITKNLYYKLIQVSEKSRYVIFDERAISDTTTSIAESSANNYLKLMNLLVTSTGVSKYGNVLAVNNGFFGNLNTLGADGKAGAKQVADIINRGNYRDVNKGGGTSRKYRVLEIEPCYPVDLYLAEHNPNKNLPRPIQNRRDGYSGAYYTYPDQVLYGVSKDEIEDNTEYYAFELSKAKIVYALNDGKDEKDQIDANQVQIDYMSVNELISTKAVILENYDLVYIGGDSSALIPYNAVNYSAADGFTFSDDGNWGTILKSFTSFDMYSHTGNFVNYVWDYRKVSGGDNSAPTNGYDISTIKLQELKDYVDAGLPILIDKEVTDAFYDSYKYDPDNENAVFKNRLKQLEQHYIDPDCNMYKFLAYAYGKKDSKTNVGWGSIYSPTSAKEQDVKHVDNTDGKYGNTIRTDTAAGYVYATVYNDTVGEAAGYRTIKTTLAGGAKRPKLSLTSYPMEYVEGDRSTTNKSKTVSFSAETDTSCTLALYVDSNGDGIFDNGEMKAGPATGTTATLSYELDDGFFGLVNWKVLATAPDGKLADAITGSSFFKPEDNMKKTVRILQIMPVNLDIEDGDVTDGHSLYFCTECQQSGKRLVNNVTVNSTEHEGAPLGLNSKKDYESTGGITLGEHEHDFGIVIYDSTTNKDDWEKNFADDLTHGYNPKKSVTERTLNDWTTEFGDYEFELEIVSVEEFNQFCASAESIDVDTAKVNKAAAVALKGTINDVLDGTTEIGSAADGAGKTLLSYQATLEDEIYNSIDTILKDGATYLNIIRNGIGTKSNPGQWMKDKQYYKLWEYVNSDINSTAMGNVPASLKAAYNNYIEKYDDEVVDRKAQYRNLMHQSGAGYEWLSNSYDIVVLGLADLFNNKDLSAVACNQLKDYVDKGGSILNSHDTLAANGTTPGSNSYNLTNTLRETFGMDRFHITGVASGEIPDGLVIADAKVAVKSFNFQSTEAVEKSYNMYLKTGLLGNYDQNAGGTIKVKASDLQYEFSESSSPTVQKLSIREKDSGWGYKDIEVSNKDVTVDIVHPNEGNTNDITSSTVAYGSEHTDKIAINLTGNISGKTYILCEANWPNTLLGTFNADGTISYQPTVTMSNTVSMKDITPTTADTHTSGNATITVKTPGNGCVVNFNNTDYNADSSGNVTISVPLVFNGSTQEIDNNSVNNNKLGSNSFTLRSDTNLINVHTVQNAGQSISIDTGVTTTSANTYAVQVYDPVGNPAPAGVNVTIQLTKKNLYKSGTTDANGIAYVTFTEAELNDNKTDISTASGKYRMYISDEPDKYFFTERLQAESAGFYGMVESRVSSYVKYNAPLGLSDLFATYDSVTKTSSNYRYALTMPEAFDHAANVNGVTFEAKYGTRKASQINKGGVTMYPFAISSDLLISPTHGQAFALDIEDPHVAVWYALGSNFVSNDPLVTAEFAHYDSSFFAASPRDGMNNYFLYSKENVFYTGAGHQLVTGSNKNNNDERRLFINVLVNSVSKGKSTPQLKLYNSCDQTGSEHEKCEDNYVDPDATEKNNELQKNKNTLFYNEHEFMYQYNIDESEAEVYPEFDFKAIAGSESIKNIKVFYDLDYGTKETNEYTADANHIMITEYTNASNMSGKRIRLRESEQGNKLLLKEDYTKPYNNSYTYIVISVQDTEGKVKTARVKINVLPHLFDLTDATLDSDSYNLADNTVILDFTDKKQFNI